MFAPTFNVWKPLCCFQKGDILRYKTEGSRFLFVIYLGFVFIYMGASVLFNIGRFVANHSNGYYSNIDIITMQNVILVAALYPAIEAIKFLYLRLVKEEPFRPLVYLLGIFTKKIVAIPSLWYLFVFLLALAGHLDVLIKLLEQIYSADADVASSYIISLVQPFMLGLILMATSAFMNIVIAFPFIMLSAPPRQSTSPEVCLAPNSYVKPKRKAKLNRTKRKKQR